jgi:hypothetical protein
MKIYFESPQEAILFKDALCSVLCIVSKGHTILPTCMKKLKFLFELQKEADKMLIQVKKDSSSSLHHL